MFQRAFTVCILATVFDFTPVAAETPVDFSSEVLAVFQQTCFECHDGRKQRSGLRLDVMSRAMRGGESGEPVIVPGQSENSGLIQRIRSADPDTRMPPEGARLSDRQISRLAKWIDDGAVWPDEFAGRDPADHWAFRPPVKSDPPAVGDERWVRNDVDRFVLARLDAEGLAPSPAADRVTLIRRLSLDLIGLPPTVEQVDAFLADGSDDAYSRLVERLLRSSHYGERWGRHWLDAARYADSDGYEKDKSRQVWFYRDWVVQAINRDLPYDQFIVQQLAGDLLPDAGQDEIVATGFLRNSMINEEGGIDPEQFRMEAMFDRMDAIGKGILGLTIQCAQCHDHKYDPLTQREYYRLFAYLNNDDEANVVVYLPEEQQVRAELFRDVKQMEDELQHGRPGWELEMASWEAQVRAGQPTWHVIRPHVDELSTGGQKYLPLPDGSFLAMGYAPTKHTVKLATGSPVPEIRGFRLELLNDPNLPLGGPGRSIFGTGALTEFEVEVAVLSEPAKSTKVKLARAISDAVAPVRPLPKTYDDLTGKKRVTGPAEMAIDGDPLTAYGFDLGPGRGNEPHVVLFVPQTPLRCPDDARLTIYLSQQHGGWNSDDNQNHNLGRFRLSVTPDDVSRATALSPRVEAALLIPRDQRNSTHQATIFRHWRTTVPDWAEANQCIDELWHGHPEGASQLVLRARDVRRQTHVLERGDFLKPREVVHAGTPAFLHENRAADASRLSLARWLVDRRSPTTARSLVNRVWQAYFGIGIVSTSEDMGTQSQPPSHPRLLDWLAVDFMEHGWSLKHLHRTIVNSATYRQSSHVSSELYRRDPYNQLLARGARLRVEAEIVRDIFLAASGLLNPTIGGPSVYPPLPEFMLKPPVSYGPKVWFEAHGPDRYRRGLYAFRYRSVPYPVLQNFDAPNGDFACVRRSRSNTPLQALTTLNEPVCMECSRALAARTVAQTDLTDQQKVVYAFRRCVSRKPEQAEVEELLDLLSRQRSRRSAESTDSPGAEEAADGGADLRAWTTVARVILNLDETISKE